MKVKEIRDENGGLIEIKTTPYEGGICTEYFLNGKKHRENGPAHECKSILAWYRHGVYHRLDGPAYEYNGAFPYQDYYIDGEKLTLKQWEQAVAKLKSKICYQCLIID